MFPHKIVIYMVCFWLFQSPQKIWSKIQSIEKKMGRIRSEQLGYEPRKIDIDIISFNDEIIETQDLQIPHPQMQNRLFCFLCGI